MSIPSILTLLNVSGILSAVTALALITYTFYTMMQAHPKRLTQRILETKPKPPPKPVPMKRIVEVVRSEEITEKLDSFFADDHLNPGWYRT